MYLLEIWRNMLDKGRYVCTMFMDLSKAFDKIHQDFIISKLGTLGTLQYMISYSTNRQQRVTVNTNFRT